VRIRYYCTSHSQQNGTFQQPKIDRVNLISQSVLRTLMVTTSRGANASSRAKKSLRNTIMRSKRTRKYNSSLQLVYERTERIRFRVIEMMTFFFIAIVFLASASNSFVFDRTIQSRGVLKLKLAAKQQKGSNARGFGRSSNSPSTASKLVGKDPASSPPSTPESTLSEPFLQSVEKGGSSRTPSMDDVPPEERTKKILREKYGLKSLEEQQLDAKQLEMLQERRKKMTEWKKQIELDEDLDIMAMIPGPILIAVDRFLKVGLALSSLLFVGAGLGITVEAWSKTSGEPLPENIDNFIVNVVEPNFTTGLLVLLGFSISLGAFAAAQLSSQGAQYKED
jgi:hypothetical protein